jgi:hypothetical protein
MNETVQHLYSNNFLRTEKDLQTFLLFLLKGGIDKNTRDSIGFAAARFVEMQTANKTIGPGGIRLEPRDKQSLDALQLNGFDILNPAFSPEELSELDRFTKESEVEYGRGSFNDAGLSGACLYSDVPPKVRFAHYKTNELCRCPSAYRIANDKRLLSLVTAYLGAPATISTLTMWWSFPSSEPPGGMQMFHHDRGDFRSCNLFVYLTDVSEATGPHAFVPKTHEMRTLYPYATQILQNDPAKLKKFFKWMEQHRKPDQEVYDYFGESNVQVFTGPKGTSFLEDTRGLHKATIPLSGPRLAFEIVYSVLPKLNETLVPVSRSELPFLEDPDSIDPLVRYATRQIYI